MATEHEIYLKQEEILSKLEVPDRRKAKLCQYHSGGDRYCRMTSQTTCKGCRFFSPNMVAKIRLMVENTMELEDQVDRANKRIGILDGYNTELFEDNEYLRSRIIRQHRRERLLRKKMRRANEASGRRRRSRTRTSQC